MSLESLSSVYEKVPLHYIEVNFLIHIVWLVGTIQPIALLNLLESSNKAGDMFFQYKNQSLPSSDSCWRMIISA